jgi:hypothetical protein
MIFDTSLLMKEFNLGERLLQLPLSQLREALDAIEELDQLLLEMLIKEGNQVEAINWRKKMVERKQKREVFFEFRR